MVKRVVFFLALMCGLSFFLYGIGNAQDFLESTQLLLLRLTAVLGVLLTVSSLSGALVDVFYTFVDRAPRFLFGAFAYCLCAGFGFFSAVFTNGILVLAAGNLP